MLDTSTCTTDQTRSRLVQIGDDACLEEGVAFSGVHLLEFLSRPHLLNRIVTISVAVRHRLGFGAESRAHPSPPLGLGERGAEHAVLIPDPGIEHPSPPQARVPALDIGDGQPCQRDPSDVVLPDRPHAALLIPRRRGSPRVEVLLDPRVEHALTDRPAADD